MINGLVLSTLYFGLWRDMLCIKENGMVNIVCNWLYEIYGVEGKKAEGILAACTSLAQKIGAAIAMFLTGAVLQAFGYVGGQAVQSQSALNAIYGMYIILPIIIMAGAFICMYCYKLDNKLPQIEELEERRAKKID